MLLGVRGGDEYGEKIQKTYKGREYYDEIINDCIQQSSDRLRGRVTENRTSRDKIPPKKKTEKFSKVWKINGNFSWIIFPDKIVFDKTKKNVLFLDFFFFKNRTVETREKNRSLRLVQRTGAKGCRRHGARH